MGYTHYLEDQKPVTDKQWEQLTHFVYCLFLRSVKNGEPLANAMGDRYTIPSIKSRYIAFNGIEHDSHETCVVEKEPDGAFSFCKTAYKSYDRYVVAFYSYIDDLGIARFSSDGGTADHIAGKRLRNLVLRDMMKEHLIITDVFKYVTDHHIEHFNHASDLYIAVTDETTEIIENYKYKQNVTIFDDAITGVKMYDIPFAYPG